MGGWGICVQDVCGSAAAAQPFGVFQQASAAGPCMPTRMGTCYFLHRWSGCVHLRGIDLIARQMQYQEADVPPLCCTRLILSAALV